MGIWLLTYESLTLSLLWVAMGMAWKARKASPLRGVCLGAMILLPLVVYAALAAIYRYLSSASKVELDPRLPFILLLLVGGYLIGVVVLWRKGSRPLPAGAAPEAANDRQTLQQVSRWPVGKLAIATLVAFVLHTLTYWNLDSAMQQRLEALRVEAAAKALAAAPGNPADRENAALIYEQAFKRLPKYDDLPKEFNDWVNSKYVAEHPELFEDPQLIEFLQSQAAAMELMRQAAKLPECSFERNYAEPRIDMAIPEVQDMRQAGRFLLLQARVDAAEGDLGGAIAEIQPVYVMGEHVAADPLLISMLVSFALDNMATETLQAVLSGQRPTTEDLAPLDFGPPNVSSRRLGRALRMEEAFGLATFGQMANEADLWPLFGAILTDGQTSSEFRWMFAAPLSLYRVLLLPDDVQTYRQLLHEYQLLAPLTPAEARPEIEKVDEKLSRQRRGIITHLLLPALKACFLSANRHAAKMETMKTGIAVHRYRAENDKLPRTLADLVPEFLPAVPLDPYTDKPLRWKVSGDNWIVYSIGEDLKDNGGALFSDTDLTGDIGFYAVLPPLPADPSAPANGQAQPARPEKPVAETKTKPGESKKPEKSKSGKEK